MKGKINLVKTPWKLTQYFGGKRVPCKGCGKEIWGELDVYKQSTSECRKCHRYRMRKIQKAKNKSLKTAAAVDRQEEG